MTANFIRTHGNELTWGNRLQMMKRINVQDKLLVQNELYQKIYQEELTNY